MSGAGLLDVNVLIALLDSSHPNHDQAHAWLAENGRKPFATCPITLNGCIRILSDPRYPSFTATPSDVAGRLREDLCSNKNHLFWADDLIPLDPAIFRSDKIGGSRCLTDVYLLALAVAHGGHLITFDRSIPWAAVRGCSKTHLHVLGA